MRLPDFNFGLVVSLNVLRSEVLQAHRRSDSSSDGVKIRTESALLLGGLYKKYIN